MSTSSALMPSPSPITKVRIERDLSEIPKNDPSSPIIFADKVDGNLFHIEVALVGPESTPYEGGIFLLDLRLQDNFPVSWKIPVYSK